MRDNVADITELILNDPTVLLSGGLFTVSLIELCIIVQQAKIIDKERKKQKELLKRLEKLNLDEDTQKKIKKIFGEI